MNTTLHPIAHCGRACVAFVVFGAIAFAQSAETRRLVAGLASDDEAARVQARQMLPRAGFEAAVLALPLLRDERDPVRRAAFNTLRDIAHDVTATPNERVAMTDALCALLDADEAARTQKLALRLMAITAPAGWNPTPIAALLSNPGVREEARGALQHIDSAESCAAIRAAMDSAEPGFAVALIDSLGAMDTRPSQGIDPLLNHANETVRAAAARALARSGRADLIAAFENVEGGASDSTRGGVLDAQLRLADAMIARGGNWNAAISIYERVLASSDDAALQGAALAGLGRHGDESSADLLMDAIAGHYGDGAIAPALSALATVQGRAAQVRVLARYAELPAATQPGVLAVLGQTQAPAYQVLLERERQSKDGMTPVVDDAARQP